MIQLVPQLKVLVACEPVDFRKGIDSLACVCRQQFQLDPLWQFLPPFEVLILPQNSHYRWFSFLGTHHFPVAGHEIGMN